MIEDTPKKLYTGSVYRGILSLEGGRAPHLAAQLLSNFKVLSREDFMTYSKTVVPHHEFHKLILEFGRREILSLDEHFMDFETGAIPDRIHDYKLNHPGTWGISIHKVTFDSSESIFGSKVTKFYLVINYQTTSQGSFYDHSLKVWSELVKETVKAVSATGTPRTIAAPLVYLMDFMKTVDHAVDFHNQCYCRMAKTPEVMYTKEQVTSGMALDYVNITITRK